MSSPRPGPPRKREKRWDQTSSPWISTRRRRRGPRTALSLRRRRLLYRRRRPRRPRRATAYPRSCQRWATGAATRSPHQCRPSKYSSEHITLDSLAPPKQGSGEPRVRRLPRALVPAARRRFGFRLLRLRFGLRLRFWGRLGRGSNGPRRLRARRFALPLLPFRRVRRGARRHVPVVGGLLFDRRRAAPPLLARARREPPARGRAEEREDLRYHSVAG